MPSGHATNITTTPQGATKAVYLTDADCDLILEGIRSGLPIQFACEQAGTSATQFKMRRGRDPLLQERFERAHAEGHESLLNIIENEVFHQAIVLKNWKALEKLAMVHLPAWAVLRTQRYEHSGSVEHTVQLKQQILEATQGMSLEEMKTALLLMDAQSQQHPLIEQSAA